MVYSPADMALHNACSMDSKQELAATVQLERSNQYHKLGVNHMTLQSVVTNCPEGRKTGGFPLSRKKSGSTAQSGV